MYWDDEYKNRKRLWGERPSELADAAVKYLKKCKSDDEVLNILDIGCGYGRDAFYYVDNLDCKVLGVDVSEKAIEIASETALKEREKGAEFQIQDFRELEEATYDVVSVSNLYQLLRKDERDELRKAIVRTLKQGGLLFLSTLSAHDPEHQGKGVPIPGEPNSFQERVYLHLCIREELIDDFSFLNIKELYEHEYDEPRATGETHHHISWILIGENGKILDDKEKS